MAKCLCKVFRMCCPCLSCDSKTSRTKPTAKSPKTVKTKKSEDTDKEPKTAMTPMTVSDPDDVRYVKTQRTEDIDSHDDSSMKPKKTRKMWEKKSGITSPLDIEDIHLTEEYEIPEDYPSRDRCLETVGIEMGDSLDMGSFATVYKVVDNRTGQQMACKVIQIGQLSRDSAKFSSLKTELFIMCRTKHENLIAISRHFIIRDNRSGSQSCYIIMEFANGGNVVTRMLVPGTDGQQSSYRRLSEQKAKDYFRQISNGLIYLHKQRIAHKDLKLQNILVCISADGQETLKITDFGLSRLSYDSKHNKIIKARTGTGTLEYMSPQILRLFIYDLSGQIVDKLREYDPFRADCWALGVCLYTMVIAEHPFNGSCDDIEELIAMYGRMKKREIVFTPNTAAMYSTECLEMIVQLLEPDPNLRLSMDIVIRHKWLND